MTSKKYYEKPKIRYKTGSHKKQKKLTDFGGDRMP